MINLDKEITDVDCICRGCGKRMYSVPNIRKGVRISGLHKECFDGDNVFRKK